MDLGIFFFNFLLHLSFYFSYFASRDTFVLKRFHRVTTSDTFNTMNRINIIKKLEVRPNKQFFSADSQHREYHERTNTKVQTNKTAIFRADDIT